MSDEYSNEDLFNEVREMRISLKRMKVVINQLIDIILEDVEYEEMPIQDNIIYTNPYDNYTSFEEISNT